MRRERDGRKSKIYIISARSQMLKVGISYDPIRRLGTLQGHSPFVLWPEYTFEIDNPISWERRFHRILKDYRSHGEWFKLPVSRALEIMRNAVKGQAKIRKYTYKAKQDNFIEGDPFIA